MKLYTLNDVKNKRIDKDPSGYPKFLMNEDGDYYVRKDCAETMLPPIVLEKHPEDIWLAVVLYIKQETGGHDLGEEYGIDRRDELKESISLIRMAESSDIEDWYTMAKVGAQYYAVEA